MQKGIALYLMVVITGIGLAIALGVSDIVFLESRVSRGLLPSFRAFFAADAGAECASYWHVSQDVFNPASPPGTVKCNGSDVTVFPSSVPGDFPVEGNIERFNFSYDYPDPVGNVSCITVHVAKAVVNGSSNYPSPCVSIRSSGQNRACGGAIQERTLERTLIVQDPEQCEFAF